MLRSEMYGSSKIQGKTKKKLKLTENYLWNESKCTKMRSQPKWNIHLDDELQQMNGKVCPGLRAALLLAGASWLTEIISTQPCDRTSWNPLSLFCCFSSPLLLPVAPPCHIIAPYIASFIGSKSHHEWNNFFSPFLSQLFFFFFSLKAPKQLRGWLGNVTGFDSFHLIVL